MARRGGVPECGRRRKCCDRVCGRWLVDNRGGTGWNIKVGRRIRWQCQRGGWVSARVAPDNEKGRNRHYQQHDEATSTDLRRAVFLFRFRVLCHNVFTPGAH